MSFNFPLIYPLFAPLPELVGFLSGRSGRGGGKGWLEVAAWPGKAGWFELEPGKPFLSFSFGKPFKKNYRSPGKPGSQLNPWSGGSNLGIKLTRRTLQRNVKSCLFSDSKAGCPFWFSTWLPRRRQGFLRQFFALLAPRALSSFDLEPACSSKQSVKYPLTNSKHKLQKYKIQF